MNEMSTLIERLAANLAQQLPPDTLTRVVPAAVVLLIAGIGLSVLGAKLARPGFALLFAGLGATFGAFFGRESGYSVPLCAMVAAAMLATVAHLTFRIWAGVATALALTVVALGAFGYRNVAPHVTEFESVYVAPAFQATVPSDGASTEVKSPMFDKNAGEWAQQFWSYIKQEHANVALNGQLLVAAALAAGLFIGVVLVRPMLILTTSLFGTAFMVSGIMTLLGRLVPSAYQAVENNPGIMGMGIGGLFVTSVILQTLLTRRAAVAAPAKG